MENTIFLESYLTDEDSKQIAVSLESFVIYCIYKCCNPRDVSLKFVVLQKSAGKEQFILILNDEKLHFIDKKEVPWQVASCLYPVVLYENTVITGLCAVARHICKYRCCPKYPQEHEEGLLGFRKSCLQAPNEVSIWTKFCEVDLIRTVKEILNTEQLNEVPKNLVRFENHLNKPVRVHNVYKLIRDIKKENLKKNNVRQEEIKENQQVADKTRIPKARKWKSNIKKELVVDSSTKIEDLEINHQFAEGPFITLADLILLPPYHILVQSFGESTFKLLLPLTYKWVKNIINILTFQNLTALVIFKNKLLVTKDIVIPTAENVSLYKCDPKRHNPKKRLYTKETDIERALSTLSNGMELEITNNEFKLKIDWAVVPEGANPCAGHLPDERMDRKTQQLENLALCVLNVAKDNDLIVDFCSGSGHLGILLAYLLPKCTIILLENKEQSLLRARDRVHKMNLTNVYFFQCNLDFFCGKFDIGIALHACGIASDLVLDKCLKANAKFVLCPCCYGSLHATDRLAYPRSTKFGSVPIDQYLCIGHAADQTHEEHPLTVRGARCMAVIDSDRARLAEEFGYKVTLTRLKPLSCTPKNNLLIGVPS